MNECIGTYERRADGTTYWNGRKITPAYAAWMKRNAETSMALHKYHNHLKWYLSWHEWKLLWGKQGKMWTMRDCGKRQKENRCPRVTRGSPACGCPSESKELGIHWRLHGPEGLT